MKEFLFLFRSDSTEMQKLSPDEMQAQMGRWSVWLNKLSEQGRYLGGDRLSREEAKVVGDFGNVVTDGPFVEAKELVGGYILINAENMTEAVEISKGCPIYHIKGLVEIRTSMQ
jgi:hypothetical protein